MISEIDQLCQRVECVLLLQFSVKCLTRKGGSQDYVDIAHVILKYPAILRSDFEQAHEVAHEHSLSVSGVLYH